MSALLLAPITEAGLRANIARLGEQVARTVKMVRALATYRPQLPSGDIIYLPAPAQPIGHKAEITLAESLSPSDRYILAPMLQSMADATALYAAGRLSEAEIIDHLSGYLKLARQLGSEKTRRVLTRFDRTSARARIGAL